MAILYVDDLIILASNITLKWLKSKLKKKFEISNLKKLHYCLGVEFERNRKACTIIMNQKSYIKEILSVSTWKMQTGRNFVRCKFKIVKTWRWRIWNCAKEIGRYFIQARVGTRIGLAFAVNMVSQFMLKVDPPHWMAIKRIMRYFKSVLDLKLCLKDKDIVLRGFCYADHTGDANDWRSTIGYMFVIGNGVISWKCKNNQSLHCLWWSRSTWPLAIARRKQFGLGKFWQMWDTCKKAWYLSGVTIKDA